MTRRPEVEAALLVLLRDASPMTAADMIAAIDDDHVHIEDGCTSEEITAALAYLVSRELVEVTFSLAGPDGADVAERAAAWHREQVRAAEVSR